MSQTLALFLVIMAGWCADLNGTAQTPPVVPTSRGAEVGDSVTAILVQEHLTTAEELFGQDNAAKALAHLARAMRLDTNSTVAAERVLSALIWRGFALPLLPPIQIQGELRHLRFSFDGREFTTSTEGSSARWNALTGEQLGRTLTIAGKTGRSWTSADGRLRLVAFENPDGSPAATNAQVWDTRTGRKLFEIPDPERRITAVEFSRDGRLLAVARDQVAGELWDVGRGRPRSKFPITEHGRERGTKSFAFSQDGRKLGAVGGDDSARVWNVQSGKELFGKPVTNLRSIEFSPDGAKLLTVSGAAVVWDIRRGQVVFQEGEHIGGGVRAAHFSPDGSRLAILTWTSGDRARVVVTDIAEAPTAAGSSIALRGKPEDFFVGDVVFGSDGETLLAVDPPRIWSARTGEVLSEPIRHDASSPSAVLSPRGDRLLTAWGGKVRVMDARPGGLRPIPFESFLKSAASRIEFSPNGRWALTVSGGFVEARDAKTWKTVSPRMPYGGTRLYPFNDDSSIDSAASDQPGLVVDRPLSKAVAALELSTINFYSSVERSLLDVQISNDGRRAVTLAITTNGPATEEDRSAQIWNVRTGARIGDRISVPALPSGTGITLSPDGERLVAHHGLMLGIWNAVTGQIMVDNMVRKAGVDKVVFSPDGRYFIAGVDVWDTKAARPVNTSFAFGTDPKVVQFSPDGRLLATENGVFDFPGGRQMFSFSGIDGVSAVVFSPDGRLLATSSEHPTSLGSTLRIWDVRTGQQTIPPVQAREVCQFSSDGNHLLTVGRVLDVRSGQPVSEVMELSGSQRSFCFSLDGHYVFTSKFAEPQVWPIPVLNGLIPPWLPALAELVAGQRLDEENGYQLVSPDGFFKLKMQITHSTALDEATRWAKWFLADRVTRPPYPK